MPAIDRPRDRALAARAAMQHGLLTARDLDELGFTRGECNHRRRTGQWERMGRGVWRIAGAPATWEQSLLAAVILAGPDAVVSHRAAAALHAFEGFHPGPVEVLVPRRDRSRVGPGTVHSTRELPPIDRTEIGGFPVTSASRTILDLAALAGVSTRALNRAIDSAVHDGLTSPAFLRSRLDDRRRPGLAGVRALDLALADAGGHSHLERAFLRVVRRAGLPRPRCQVVHRSGGRTVARVDFEWTEQRVVVEVSGQRGHASEAERAKDARRQNELQSAGYRVLEFTTSQVLRDEGYVVATLRRALDFTGRAGASG